jgi:hypothetical protein
MAFRRTVCAVLCVALSLQPFATTVAAATAAETASITADDIHARFPNARIVYLPESELPRLREAARQLDASTPGTPGLYLVENAEDLRAVPLTAPPAPMVSNPNPCGTGLAASPGPRGGDVEVTTNSVDLAVQIVSRAGVRTSGDDDLAVVVFVIVGFVVIYALIAYTGKYFYDAYSNYRQCPKWWDITLQTGAFGGERDGYLSALRVSTGVEDDVTRIGLTGELGRIRFNRAGGENSIDSNYWMIGPAVRWYTSGMTGASYVSAELLAGTGSDRNLGTMSAARLGLNFPLGVRARLGLMLGALYSDVRRTQGTLSDDSEMHMMFGVEVGTRF